VILNIFPDVEIVDIAIPMQAFEVLERSRKIGAILFLFSVGHGAPCGCSDPGVERTPASYRDQRQASLVALTTASSP